MYEIVSESDTRGRNEKGGLSCKIIPSTAIRVLILSFSGTIEGE